MVSETDRSSKNVLTYEIKPTPGITKIRVIIRPSGTEPKTKMYIEICTPPLGATSLDSIRTNIENIRLELEKAVIQHCLQLVDINFPERGFALFWQLPVETKLRYFDAEKEIEALIGIEEKNIREKRLKTILSFL